MLFLTGAGYADYEKVNWHGGILLMPPIPLVLDKKNSGLDYSKPPLVI